jgi:hypothetical protein
MTLDEKKAKFYEMTKSSPPDWRGDMDDRLTSIFQGKATVNDIYMFAVLYGSRHLGLVEAIQSGIAFTPLYEVMRE